MQIRQNRLLGLKVERDDDQYIDRQAVTEEIAASRRLCAKHNWPLIDVTRRSIEETAAAVLAHARRAPPPYRRRDHAAVARRGAAGAGLKERGAPNVVGGRRRSGRGTPGRHRRTRRGSGRAATGASGDRRAARARQSLRGGGALSRPPRTLGADQTLALGAEHFAKPADRAAARAQLRALCGRTHELHSAIAFVKDENVLFEHVGVARLTMRPFSDEFLDAYLDAAGTAATASVGGYQLEGLGVQLFERVDGDYFTVLGLPLMQVLDFLRRRRVVSRDERRGTIRSLPDRLARHGQIDRGQILRRGRRAGARFRRRRARAL